MNGNSRTSSRGSVSVVRLFYRVWRGMPVLSALWLGLPLALGLLIVPGFSAQRALVDLFVHRSADQQWGELLQLAWPPLATFTGVSLLRVALSALHSVADARFRDLATMRIQAEVQRKAVSVPLERLEQAAYHDRLQRAKSMAGTDLFGLLQQIVSCFRLIFELMGLLAVAWLAHPMIGVLLAVVFALSFAIRLEADIVVRRLNRDLTRSGRLSDYLQETLTRPETVKELRVFGSLDYLIRKWSGMLRDSLALRMNARRREIKRGILISSAQIIGLMGAIVWMVLQLQSGTFTAGTFVVVFLAMRQAYGISMRMTHPVGKIYIQSGKVGDLLAFLREPAELRTREETPSANDPANAAPQEPGPIIFDHVTYQYPGADHPALHQLRLTLNPGETVALVGENGAGKSTLARLLLGLYHPTAGRITWNGTDYKELDPDLLRRSASAVFQDFVRFETTVRDNVGFGLPERMPNDTAILRAMEASGAAALARLSGGLDAKVGHLSAGGRELSGGQWQRLAIARAAFRDAPLLVLDEPTAALDPQHETELYRSFREIAQGKTVLFISHRLGWARFANRIVVLKQGRIVEEGKHERLLAQDGEYAAMFRAQALWYRGAVY
ncbi:ABC transporter ATP-binding protein [Paenibacillus cymbidii]|uniref:ABC transporter ATP-binding protein n=1 Tax=Paenibacillus cymbidii TaxID=1639034 RepID=UPI001080528C|nr:ABC transporter ATP-binding protein [Paenibacillus cymbidii]